MKAEKRTKRWGPADWKRLPSWAVELESARYIDGHRVTRATNEPVRFWWLDAQWVPLRVTRRDIEP